MSTTIIAGSAPPAGVQVRVLPLRRGVSEAPDRASGAPAAATTPPVANATARRSTRGWVRQPQCGWCLIGDEHPAVLTELHRAHVRREVGARALAALARRRLEGDVPSARALSRHLAGHLHREHYVEDSDADDAPARGGAQTDEVSALWALHDRLERRMRQLDAGLAITADGEAIDLHRIAQMSGLANADRGVLATIARSRGSPSATLAAVKHALRVYAKAYASAVADELRHLVDEAEEAGVHDLAERMRGVLGRMGVLARQAAVTALDETARELKLNASGG